MNLRGIKSGYSIGLDMGTGSVGWAVTNEQGDLLHFKRKPTWGSRLFDSANPASEARVHRGQRRRYIRRRWRLNLLQSLFKEHMEKVDPDFFMRLEQSRIIEGDPIFNGSDFSKADYYDRFPTIYHLRKWLMETDEQADLRLIYLAMHNIVKHRGNFLREGQSLSAKNADAGAAVSSFIEALNNWCDSRELERLVCDESEQEALAGKIAALLADTNRSRREISEEIAPLVAVPMEEAQASKKFSKAIAGAMLGLSVEFKNIFGEFECEKTKVSLGKEEELEKLAEACPDDCAELLEALCSVYAAYLLQGLLSYKDADVSYKTGDSISASMIAKYNQYHADLQTLKSLVREYVPAEYSSFFRGELYEDIAKYDYFKAKGYTAYNLGKTKYDDFAKEVKKLFSGTAAEQDERYIRMAAAFVEQRFLRRLKTSDNGSIYYQLHLEELQAIIGNQARFYPFLKEEANKLESLVTFRIPYYVGPLSTKNAAEDKHGKRFAWSERKPGMEEAVITPWNWDSIIDKDKSAEKFILRMTGDCTYLAGEKVLPKCSLLYEEYCVLNELNGMRWAEGAENEHRFDAAQREGIIRDLFQNKRTVRLKDIEDWLVRVGDAVNPHVSGSQGETSVTSKLNTYRFFAKDVFGVSELDPSLIPAIEEIVLWSTLFEDRSIFEQRLESAYGSQGSGLLSAEQVKAIKKKRFTGWGRLSEKFLTGVKVGAQDGNEVSIMDVLRYGDPNTNSRQGRTMVMMEVLRDEALGFQQRVDDLNREYYASHGSEMGVNDLPGSPAIRRSLNQAMRIVNEIAKIADGHPANIFIEVTRDEDPRNKGKRTRRRYDQIKESLTAMKKEAPEVWAQIQKTAPADLDERLTLYFMQGGKCMYSGKPLDIAQLSDTAKYEVDHIIPRAYIKDDSFENKALVIRKENQRKTDELLLDQRVRHNMREYWERLHDVKLIGDKKFNNLMRSHISSGMMKGFIARQLVETSQMVKMIQALLKVQYPNTNIVPVKASMSHNLREAMGLVKCREANDFHHAHDAYLACRLGLFIQIRHSKMYENPIAYEHAIRKYVQSQSEQFARTHKMPGSAGFIVDSFMRSGFDKETGEVLKDAWDAEAEMEGIRKALNYRQCYVTRMPYEDTGLFWKATIYSPRDPKMGSKLALSVKKGLDAKQYGGFSSQQFAYFFIYEAKKKGKPCFRFAEVPVWLAGRVGQHPDALAEYANELAEAEGLEFIAITRSRILKRQLIEIDGDRLVITGAEEVRNATQCSFGVDELTFMSNPAEKPGEIDEFIEVVVGKGERNAPALMRKLDMRPKIEGLRSLGFDDKNRLLTQLVRIINGSDRQIDLSLLGGAKTAGQFKVNFNKRLNEGGTEFLIIDQSVTGMFERKTRVGL